MYDKDIFDTNQMEQKLKPYVKRESMDQFALVMRRIDAKLVPKQIGELLSSRSLVMSNLTLLTDGYDNMALQIATFCTSANAEVIKVHALLTEGPMGSKGNTITEFVDLVDNWSDSDRSPFALNVKLPALPKVLYTSASESMRVTSANRKLG